MIGQIRERRATEAGHLLKEGTSRALCALGVDRLASAITADRLLVVTYHGIVGTRLDPPCPWQIEAPLFRAQLAWLARHRSVMPLDECLRRMREGEPLPRRSTAITFDDGYRSVLTRAVPVLDELGVPATVFVVTDAIGLPRLLWHDELYLAVALTTEHELDLRPEGGARHRLGSPSLRGTALAFATEAVRAIGPAHQGDAVRAITGRLGVDPARRAESADFTLLSRDEIAAMARGGRIAFGAHGRTHVPLALLPEAAAAEEVRGSLACVRRLTGADRVPFAYPFGGAEDFDRTVAELARSCGATCALTSLPGLNASCGDRFALRRIGAEGGLSASRFRLRISGFSRWGLMGVAALAARRSARLRAAIRSLRGLWRRFGFHRETVTIFTRTADEGSAAAAPTRDRTFDFGRTSAAELASFASRLAPRDTGGFLARTRARFADGTPCFVIRRGTGIVACAWVSEATRVHIAEIERTVEIGRDAVYVFDAVTAPAWRGRGLYPMLLDRIARCHGGRTAVIAASATNIPSLRGIVKAGFTPSATHRFLKVAGVVIRGRPARGEASPGPS